MKNKKILFYINTLILILLSGCGGVKVDKQVFLKTLGDYMFATETGNYTYRIVLKPKQGTFSETLLGTTVADSNLVVYREDLPIEEIQTGSPGEPPPKLKETKIGAFKIQPNAKYEIIDSPKGENTKFLITIDVTTFREETPNQHEETDFSYLVNFEVRKQT